MKLLFISLGCDKNLVDSEYMIGMLTSHGIELTDDETEADIIIVNSCCFIGDAKEESINTILEMAEQKKTGCCKSLIVTGCLAQRYQEEVKKEIPEVDAILGTNSYDSIWEALESTLKNQFYENFNTLSGLPKHNARRVVTTGGHFAYLKIAEGCNKNCTYCVIPSVRGRYRSVPMEELVQSAEELAANGVKELILVAQETTLYGVDLYGRKCLHELLDRLNEIPGLFWIRIMYCYPEEIYEELIDSIIKDKKVCHYLDMPIQHCNDTILKRMGRKTNKKELVERITNLRKRIPDITLRTTLICGFPGETGEQHEELMQFVKETLGGKIKEARVSHRLKTHPVCLTAGEGFSFEMEKYFKNFQMPEPIKAERILELNVDHPAVKAMAAALATDRDKAALYAKILYDQANLIAGLPLEDPSAYTDMVAQLMQ